MCTRDVCRVKYDVYLYMFLSLYRHCKGMCFYDLNAMNKTMKISDILLFSPPI